ncbi:hypothetical protein [Haloferula rosea]|uniref:Uncharacterized protein n=1 Tax=Haloferula rosea TaxID=490093 RepID=A0A934R8E1_9BACT|nr:hypothetical protein [Haloferula rosea]MBK1826177.1 hypothetical protein [Haloferula rosea]
MKAPCLLLLSVPFALQGDILSEFGTFAGSDSPVYDARDFDPDRAAEEPIQAPFSPGDSDFGVQQVLSPYDGPPPVHVFANLDFAYTDNAPAQFRALEDESWYASALVGMAWQPKIAAGWFADFGLIQEFYQFESSNALDFENFRGHLGVVKTLVDLDDTVFYARYEYQRLTTGSWSRGNYSAQRIRTGLQKDLFVRSRHHLAAGVSAAFDIDANPERLERQEYAADLSYTYWILNDLRTTMSWRGAFWDFDNGGREDWNHTLGVELAWNFHPHASAYTSVFYSDNDSNSPLGVNDFSAWQAGVGLGLIFSF